MELPGTPAYSGKQDKHGRKAAGSGENLEAANVYADDSGEVGCHETKNVEGKGMVFKQEN